MGVESVLDRAGSAIRCVWKGEDGLPGLDEKKLYFDRVEPIDLLLVVRFRVS